MSRKNNQNLHPELKDIRRELEAIMAMGHHGYKVYEDWIALMFYAFQRDDPHYLEIMRRYSNTAPVGHREADHFAMALHCLMQYMARTHEEVLGPLFMEYASSKYKGQFFTSLDVARVMASITQTNIPEGRRFTVGDPACGAGVGLIACAKAQTFEQNNRAFFVGQDIDLNCARMCALNLMFFNLDGLVLWGNTLTMEVWGAWRTIRSVALGGSLRSTDVEEAKAWVSGASRAQKKGTPSVKIGEKKWGEMEQLTLL